MAVCDTDQAKSKILAWLIYIQEKRDMLSRGRGRGWGDLISLGAFFADSAARFSCKGSPT